MGLDFIGAECNRLAEHRQRAAGDTELPHDVEMFKAVGLTGQQILIRLEDLPGLSRVFFQKFDAKHARPGFEELPEKLRAALRLRVEDCVPAADIRLDRMLDADAVAQLDVVRVAWTSAVGAVRAGREERCDHAVLHMKHRQVLVNDQLEPCRRRRV